MKVSFAPRFSLLLAVLVSILAPRLPAFADSFQDAFQKGAEAYRTADYIGAAELFERSTALRPASGALLNLGNARWRLGHSGPAILAWERAIWLDPFNRSAQGNLRFARRALQVESPELAWFEVVSTWLPVNWWAWLAGFSFWVAIAAALLPGIFRLKKAGWHQAVAALGLTLFLLSLPALAGVRSRSQLGFILQKDTSLRLTPTAQSQDVTRLTAGEPARFERKRGNYLLIRTSRAAGWVLQDQFSLLTQS